MRNKICSILLVGFVCCSLLLGGCRKRVSSDERPPWLSPEDTALVDVALILRCNDLVTKATEAEEKVNDLNLFFVHKFYPSSGQPEVRHYYFSSADIAKVIKLTNIRLGKYRMYAVVNAGKRLCSDSHDPLNPSGLGADLCTMDEASIGAMVASYSQTPTKADNLLMSAVDNDMVIKRSDENRPQAEIVPIRINLVRKVARVDFSYELVGPAVGKMKIKKIDVKSVPAYTALFMPSEPRPESRYNTWSIRNFGNGTMLPEFAADGFYLPENITGDVPGVAGEQDRHSKLAPTAATYLYLDGEYEGSQYGMSVYFGKDMTGGNFDVEKNVSYKLNLRLGGPSLDDARVSSMTLDIRNNTTETQPDQWVEMLAMISCSNYFNDQLVLNCNVANPSIGQVNGLFEVYKSDEFGNQGELVPNMGNYRFNILTTDDLGNGTVWCKVRYKQTEPYDQVRLSLTIQSRYGSAYFLDQVFDVKN